MGITQIALTACILLVTVLARESTQEEEKRASFTPPCEDEFPFCRLLSESESGLVCAGIPSTSNGLRALDDGRTVVDVDLALLARTVALCMTSCRNFTQKYSHLVPKSVKHALEALGGLSGTFVDVFGYKHDLCDMSPGSELFTSESRSNFISTQLYALAIMESSTNVEVGAFSKSGYLMDRVPKRLFKHLLDHHATIEYWPPEMRCEPGSLLCYSLEESESECRVNRSSSAARVSQLPAETMLMIAKALLPMAEDWVGRPLSFSNVYGIRRYTRGAFMTAHVDRTSTHVVSAIINVAQSVDEPWPLDIYDHSKVHQKVAMKPGDLLWYEGAKLPHGRVKRLNGDYFDNIFVHFRPYEPENGP